MDNKYIIYRIEERINGNDTKKYIPMYGRRLTKSTGWFWNRKYEFTDEYDWFYIKKCEEYSEGLMYAKYRSIHIKNEAKVNEAAISFDTVDEAKQAIEKFKKDSAELSRSYKEKEFKDGVKVIPVD